MKICAAIVKRIRELCKQKAITPNALSYASSVPQSTIKSILNGESTNPGIVNIKKIADAFGLTINEFFDTDYFRMLEQECDEDIE